MRPRRLDEMIGQEDVVGPGRLLRRMIEADRVTSLLLWGPPGSGKTTLAEVIARETTSRFERAHAASVGVKDIRAILEAATRRLEEDGRRTILFLDEIHRFTRAQQDVLLDDVEHGRITLIGATTENPSFTVNDALVSRSTVIRLEPLSEEGTARLIRRAIEDPERGFGGLALEVRDDAIAWWARTCDGDARRALAALEVAVLSQRREAEEGPIVVDLAAARESIRRKVARYDRDGSAHYDVASAFIKSMRGGDPDAAVHWLARMLEGGEDPRFIARRLSILASEDIGNADPAALPLVAAAWTVVERIGMPEAALVLAQATIYLACAPKSNACTRAIAAATADVREQRTVPVPRHLRDGHSAAARADSAGRDYRNPHGSPTGHLRQEYLGVDRTYYVPTDRGFEEQIRKRLEEWWGACRAADDETAGDASSPARGASER